MTPDPGFCERLELCERMHTLQSTRASTCEHRLDNLHDQIGWLVEAVGQLAGGLQILLAGLQRAESRLAVLDADAVQDIADRLRTLEQRPGRITPPSAN